MTARCLALAYAIFSTLLLLGCQPAPTPVPTPVDQTAIRTVWRASPHGNTYDLGKGPNTFCARCHSPRNWDPASKIDAAPNCVSCKFAFDPAPRHAPDNPLIAPDQWKDIGCEICHPVENGIASKQVAWLNTATGKSEPVANINDLCAKCHLDDDVLRHKIDLGNQAHKNDTCTTCHDPHSTKASCTASACHAKLFTPDAKPIVGHDAAHKSVACGACHDASGLKVGPQEGTAIWTTFRTTELLGRSTTAAFMSHNLQRKVDCARCHFPGNPWKIADSVKAP